MLQRSSTEWEIKMKHDPNACWLTLWKIKYSFQDSLVCGTTKYWIITQHNGC